MANVDVHGHRWHLLDEGDGPVVLLIHGFPFDHSMWDAQRRALRDRYRVIIPDLRGFGRSGSATDPVSIPQWADELAMLLDAAGVNTPVTVCGLSMGGCIALSFAQKYATRMSGLMLCDMRSVGESPEGKATRLKMAERVLAEGATVAAEAMLPRLFGPKTNEDHPEIVDHVRNLILTTSPRSIAAGQHALANRPDFTSFLPTISMPTLVIVGEHDAISSASEMKATAEAIPGAEFVSIANAGHLAPMENAVAVNAALETFLKRTAVRS
ncbi:MAG TPA: alpha/beta fold hydrolase [Planctomycetaceae bacterium]|jgi:pimeloyl-ACP methyl ester carboxylesterase|nr:alpha/beta fold hydrolase [Planctomycetaceae bacterium]